MRLQKTLWNVGKAFIMIILFMIITEENQTGHHGSDNNNNENVGHLQVIKSACMGHLPHRQVDASFVGSDSCCYPPSATWDCILRGRATSHTWCCIGKVPPLPRPVMVYMMALTFWSARLQLEPLEFRVWVGILPGVGPTDTNLNSGMTASLRTTKTPKPRQQSSLKLWATGFPGS